MFKRDEHRGHVLLQFIRLRIYKFCLFQFSPSSACSNSAQDFSVSLNVHSTFKMKYMKYVYEIADSVFIIAL